MSSRAYIIVTRHPLPMNRWYDTYSWEGDITGQVIINEHDYPLSELPWRLIKIEERPEWGGASYMRADGWLFLNAYGTKALEWVAQLYRGFCARFVLTCHIWGIGYTSENEEPKFANLLKPSLWRKW